MAIEFRDGDIFRWRYRDESFSRDLYWCKSRIATAKNGILRDTYWGSSGDSTAWSYEEATEVLTLDHIGNFDGLEKVSEWKRIYYADADCVDLNHSNSSRGNFYIRTGAERSREKMLEMAGYEREKAISQIIGSASRVATMDTAIRMIKEGGNLNDIHL